MTFKAAPTTQTGLHQSEALSAGIVVTHLQKNAHRNIPFKDRDWLARYHFLPKSGLVSRPANSALDVFDRFLHAPSSALNSRYRAGIGLSSVDEIPECTESHHPHKYYTRVIEVLSDDIVGVRPETPKEGPAGV